MKRRLAVWFATLRRTVHAAGVMLDRHLTTTAMCVLLTTYVRRRRAMYQKYCDRCCSQGRASFASGWHREESPI